MTRRLDWDRISVPVDLPEVRDEISYQRVVMNSGSTWDYFPGHFDPAYAESQGQPTIFVNTMHLAGFADRMMEKFKLKMETSEQPRMKH